jgi:hypothetical protein
MTDMRLPSHSARMDSVTRSADSRWAPEGRRVHRFNSPVRNLITTTSWGQRVRIHCPLKQGHLFSDRTRPKVSVKRQSMPESAPVACVDREERQSN